jgi:Spy/CpxP family protein refolding chaperone
MARIRRSGFAAAVLTLLFTYTMAAQVAPSPASPRGTTAQRAPRQVPCWQQAGISQSAIQQRKQIEESTHSQVESVCSDSSLTPQQKQQKIRELRQEARKQVEGLITPQQEQALKSCRAGRGEAPHMGGMHGGGAGPCGEIPSASKP